MRLLFALLSGAALAALCQTPAFGQDAPADAAGQSDPEDTIVVTAQRRTENLEKVPISATVLDGAALDDHAVTTLNDLQLASPALSVTDAGIIQNVNIRGIGLASNSPNVTAGVATYVDGLFQPPIVQANSFYDLRSVEVLRGPQGTFVGNNSTGGAIFINSANPDPDGVSGYLEGAYGEYDYRGGEGAVNLPLSGNVALRVAGFFRNRDSYYRDVGPFDNDAGKLDEWGARIGFLWREGALQALLKTQWNDRRTGGYAYRPTPGTPFAPFRVGDIRTLSFDAPTSNRDQATITSLELRYEFGNGVVLRSLSGYQDKKIKNLLDLDASQAPIEAGGDVSEDYFAGERQISQEINIISPTDGSLDWVVGAYYQNNDIDVRIFDQQGGFPTDILPDNERTTWGVFGQANYSLTPALELQVGTRYSHYRATGTGTVSIGRGIPGFPPDGLVVADLSGAHSDGETTGKIALNWTVSDDHLLYALAARGYKPGGFNSLTSEFDPEIVWSYEAGWKARFFDRRVRTQIDVFHNEYSEFQFNIVEPSTGFVGVDNIASAAVSGLEAQLQARFGDLGFDANFAYTDSELDPLTLVNTVALPPGQLGPQCPDGAPSDPPVCFDYTPFIVSTNGGPNLYAPEWTYNLGMDYTFDLSADVTLTPRVNYGYVDDQFTYLAYSPVSDFIEGRGLVSALVTLEFPTWHIQAYGTNLTDESYVAGQFGANESYGAPKEVGVRIGVTF